MAQDEVKIFGFSTLTTAVLFLGLSLDLKSPQAKE
jgi:hypothetical protein